MIEVEFIPIGDKTNTGDAILCHFTEPGTMIDRVVLVDGGFNETATQIAAHVRKYYGKSHIDLMVCTHPDDDHINGLFGVLDELTVGELLIHQPSAHGYTSDDVKSAKVNDLIKLAQSKGTSITTSAFAGAAFFSDAIRVAGPTQDYYKSLLGDQVTEDSLARKAWSVLKASAAALRGALASVGNDPGEGTLTDNGGTTARNNSSVVLDIQVEGYRVLLTGDAGAPALERAANFLEASGRSAIGVPAFIDVPHHGSRHNLTTEIMNRIAGPVVGATGQRTVFVSVGKEADDFPRPEVANAFTRRGYSVCATRGQVIRWQRNANPRPSWTPLTPLTWLDPDQ
ncbi:ComEC/Rec2 family competence protein [Plantibacter sp. MMLR14_011]|uniref:ComEC/Rec2 family competence protein n=1 Tax=Plantibacter sp. MMLR14_011 TaxID=1898746 RepID=UPI001587902F|nr:MBL fold metallo-hydrolase [Plantibacter sp. MMLR14_011]